MTQSARSGAVALMLGVTLSFGNVAMSMAQTASQPAAAEAPIPDVNPYSGDKKMIREGRSWYHNVCSLCHGGKGDGRGERGNGADLRIFNKGFKKYMETALNGKQLPGQSQMMPAWRGVLTNDQLYQIGAFIETLASESANWKEGVKAK